MGNRPLKETIDLFLEDHARLDCLPLRYGNLFEGRYATLIGSHDETGTSGQRKNEIDKGNTHYVGSLHHESGVVIENIRLVLRKPGKRQRRNVISALPFEVSKATRAVTDLIRSLREDGRVTPEQIRGKLHPLYIKGKITNETQFFEEMVKLGIEAKFTEMEALIASANQQAENEALHHEKAQEKIKRLEIEIKRRDQQSSGYNGETIDLAPICTLKSVIEGKRTNKRGQNVDCVFLEFEENVPTRTMDKWADPDGTKTLIAKKLIGCKVMTTTWKPEVFNPMKWCQSIYEAW